MINIISDTVTRPTRDMLQYMMAAEVGDDVFGQDPTVNALEEKAAKLFGKEAAVYCPSGTMTNQIAIKTHTQPLDEVVCDKDSHIYQYEAAGYSFNAGVGIKLIDGKFGKIFPDQIVESINPEYDWLPRTTLVVLENSCNRGGGTYYTMDEVKVIQKVCKSHGLALHLDGARIFNVLVETGDAPVAVGTCFDSISICLSKGLGAPVGSLLIGDAAFIKESRRYRKVLGGGMRQAGYMAAAGIYALDHHINRLHTDNQRARYIGNILQQQSYVKSVRPVMTNIVIFDVEPPLNAAIFLQKLLEKEVVASAFGPSTVRFVFHLDNDDEDINRLASILQNIY
ncbi:MAG TPA: GntG family PLP-dependent aldolase [Saprospiraceae bacterium]|nr:GntG family PLP-dependent aldolase [Saprospiraceae bacterium]